MKKQLDIKFYSTYQYNEFPVAKSNAASGKYENHIRISTIEEFTSEVLTLIKNSYDIL